MSVEDIKALWRPYKISEEDRKKLSDRLGRTVVYTTEPSGINEHIALVETKSGVLLTHVSIMIAISGLLLSVKTLGLGIETLLTFELVAYLCLAILCIRCQYQFDTTDFENMVEREIDQGAGTPKHQYVKVLGGELVYRERLFKFSFKALYFLTILLAATLVYSLINGASA